MLVAATAFYVALAVAQFCGAAVDGYFDTLDLRAVARRPLDAAAFWAGARPPGYPLLLRLIGPESRALLALQLALYLAAFIVVAWGLARRCATPWVRVAAFVVVTLGSLSAGWLDWAHAFSTESLSISLFVLPVGLVLVGAVDATRPRWQRVAASVAIALLLVEWLALRDLDGAWLVVATVTAALLPRLVRADAAVRRATAIVALIAVVATYVAAVGADHGKRWRYPLVNVIARRVFPDPLRKASWERAGMPDNDKTRCFKGQWASDCNSDFSGFEPWLTTSGKRTYARDLATQPRRLFLEPLEHWRALLCGDRTDEPSSPPLTFYARTKPGRLRTLWTQFFLGRWKWLRGEFVVALVLLAWARRRTRLGIDAATAPLVVLAATVYPLLLLVWHGDAMEIQRHALVPMVSARLALWGAYAVAVDRLAQSFGRSAATAGGTMSATSPSSRSVARSS